MIVFGSHPDGQTKTKQNGPEHARKHHCCQRGSTYAGRCPWGGHARDQKEEKGEKKRSQLESLKGKVEILGGFTGSNTPDGQRPSEFISLVLLVALATISCCIRGTKSWQCNRKTAARFPTTTSRRSPRSTWCCVFAVACKSS